MDLREIIYKMELTGRFSRHKATYDGQCRMMAEFLPTLIKSYLEDFDDHYPSRAVVDYFRIQVEIAAQLAEFYDARRREFYFPTSFFKACRGKYK